MGLDMFQFRYVVENEEQGYTAKRSITMDAESEATIDEILEAFQDFLTGAGYVIDPLHQKIMMVTDEDGAF
jgi:hypothetical protein